MTDELITSDHPLTAAQRSNLTALQDALIPASGDGRMPSAGDFDLVDYLVRKSDAEAEAFLEKLPEVLDSLGAGFAVAPPDERHAAVQSFSEADPGAFRELVFHTYGCYYQDDRALVGIGMEKGPPFPRGNTIEAGDLSLLDPVVKGNHTYRK